MTAFKSYRITREYVQTNPATPERVFPLLCPVREQDWLPGWQYRLVYSDSGVAELSDACSLRPTRLPLARIVAQLQKSPGS